MATKDRPIWRTDEATGKLHADTVPLVSPSYPTTAGLAEGQRVRVILDFMEGRPIVKTGTIVAVEGPHHVRVRHLGLPLRGTRREFEDSVDSRRVLAVL